MRGTRFLALGLALTLVFSSGCDTQGTQQKLSALVLPEEQIMLAEASDLLNNALGELFLYQGEIPTDRDAEPYYDPEGRRYYPVVGYASVSELRSHSRQIFTEDFCVNVLDSWTQDPEQPRFVEREGGLWATNHVTKMGWIDALVSATVQIKEQTDTRCVVTGYSQSMLGAVVREDFSLQKEAEGWRLDSYYKFNRTEPLVYDPTLGEFLTEQDDGHGSILRLAIPDRNGDALELETAMIPPFQAVLAALEYDPQSVTQVDAAERDMDVPVLQLTLYTGSYMLTGFRTGEVFITQPGGAVTRMQLDYPVGLHLLEQLVGAAKWEVKAFG